MKTIKVKCSDNSCSLQSLKDSICEVWQSQKHGPGVFAVLAVPNTFASIRKEHQKEGPCRESNAGHLHPKQVFYH